MVITPFCPHLTHLRAQNADRRRSSSSDSRRCPGSSRSPGTSRAVSAIDRNVIPKRTVRLAHGTAVGNQVFEHVGIDYSVLPVRLVPPEPLSVLAL